MSADVVIRAAGLAKQYRLAAGRVRHNTLRDLLADKLGRLARPRGEARSGREPFWALRDASFDVRRGENVGIIGLNGAGKSTLLKILSRITEPTAGMARIQGRVGALLEVGTGFHNELTGRENVYLYGAILGMSRAEVARNFASIIDFAGVEQFIDTPVKRYSSGMYVRLAFSVAAHLEPEILLLDEVLAVGDVSFQRKCIEFAKNLQRREATILFVSHNMFSIKAMCERVIYLKGGRIEFDGATEGGIERYEKDCRLTTLPWVESDSQEWPIVITGVTITDEAGHPRSVFDHGERVRLQLRYEARRPLKNPNFIVAFIRADGLACCNYSSEMDGLTFSTGGAGSIELLTPPLKLVSELYTIHILVREPGFQRVLCGQIAGTFHVRDALLDANFGVFHESAQWSCDGGQTQLPTAIESVAAATAYAADFR